VSAGQIGAEECTHSERRVLLTPPLDERNALGTPWEFSSTPGNARTQREQKSWEQKSWEQNRRPAAAQAWLVLLRRLCGSLGAELPAMPRGRYKFSLFESEKESVKDLNGIASVGGYCRSRPCAK